MSNLENKLNNLLAEYTQRDLLDLEKIMELSFALMVHANPEPWLDRFISKRHPEDLISLMLSLPIPTAQLIKQIQEADLPKGEKEEIMGDFAGKTQKIYSKIGAIVGVSDLQEKMQSNEDNLNRFMKEDAWTRSLLVVRNTPSLLKLDSDFALASMQFSAFLANDQKAVDFFLAHRNLLAECRRTSIDKVVKDRYPFVQRLGDGLNETMMLVFSGMDGYGYGDIPFSDVYEYAKKIVKNPESLISAKLDFAMGRYLLYLPSQKNWEKGKLLLEKISKWIKEFGDDYDDGVVHILNVKIALLYGTYWMNKFEIEPNIKYVDEAIDFIGTALKIAPIDDDVILIYGGLSKALIEKYQIVKKKQLLIEIIEVLNDMIKICMRFESEQYYSALFASAVCHSMMHVNHGDSHALEKAVQIHEKIITMPDAPENICLMAKGELGKIAVARYEDKKDLSSLDVAIKNLKESLGE